MFKRILVALDGSATSNRGLTIALGLAKEQLSELIALHVVDATGAVRNVGVEYGLPTYYDAMLDDVRKGGRKILSKAEAIAAKGDQSLKPVLVETQTESVAHTILAQARKLGADLIVMGTHGRRGFSRLLMGSDAEGVLREARVPVLLVHGGNRPRAARASAPKTASSHPAVASTSIVPA